MVYFEVVLALGLLGIIGGGMWWLSHHILWRSEARRALHEVAIALQNAHSEAIAKRRSLWLALVPPGELWGGKGLLRRYHWPIRYQLRSNYENHRVLWTGQGTVRGGRIWVFVDHRYAGSITLSVATAQVRTSPAWEEV
ncbi:hypothetical protein [Pasteuria penetrans]|uniref:hypothetical protein n=1 Tax=Pasteuria penetrans TaxID=86005 RepID=UPI0011F01747|nr:hypothetical protein [Pasteuria penetrans]